MHASYSASYTFVSKLTNKVLKNEDTANINGTVPQTTK